MVTTAYSPRVHSNLEAEGSEEFASLFSYRGIEESFPVNRAFIANPKTTSELRSLKALSSIPPRKEVLKVLML